MRPGILFTRLATAVAMGLSLTLAACSNDATVVSTPERPLGPLLAVGTDPVSGATLETNQDDYMPGEVVHLTGRGWGANETIALLMTEDPDTHEDVTGQVVADSTGAFSMHFYDVQEHDLGVTFTLTATGLTSGSKATVEFYDAQLDLSIATSPAAIGVTTIPYADTPNNCPAATSGSGTYTIGGVVVQVQNNHFVRFAVPVVSGYTYTGYSWSGSTSVTPASDPGNTALCVAGSNSAITGTLTLNYSAANLATATAVSGSPDPSVTGESVTFTATVTAGVNPVTTGTVTFRLGSTDCTDGTVIASSVALNGSGQATASRAFDATETGAGIRACYSGASGFDPSNGTDAQTVNKAVTTTALSSAPDPSSVGETVTFTATVAATLPGTGTPTGTVNLYQFTGVQTCAALGAAVALGTGSLTAGSVDITYASLTAGSHTLVACYLGDSNYLASDGSDTQSVNLITTTTTIGSSANPSVTGQQVTFTATVKDPLNSAVTTGSVTFKFGGTNCSDATAFSGPTALDGSGQATATATYSASQSPRTIRACYGATSSYAASENSLSQVIDPASTTTSLGASPNPSVFGQQVTFTATVAVVLPGAGTPAGDVKFYEFTGVQSCTSPGAAAVLSTETLSGAGVASFDISSLSVGGHTITGCYLGNTDFDPSSGTTTQTVNKANTSTSLGSAPAPSTFGVQVTFTATVDPVAPGAGNPSGTVSFYEFAAGGTCDAPNGTLHASEAISGGSASFDISSLDAGAHTITACYPGDASFNKSSDAITHTVNAASTTTTVGISAATPQYSDKVTLTAAVTPYQILTSEVTGTVYFYIGAAAVTCGSSAPAGSIGNDAITAADDGAASMDYTVLQAAGSYTVTGCFYSSNANFANSGDTEAITIGAEDADVIPDAGNQNAYQVELPGGTATFTLKFAVKEDVTPSPEPDVNDGALAGDISKAVLSVSLTPVGGGSATTSSCTSVTAGAGYAGTKTYTCPFISMPVETYEVEADLDGTYYAGGYSDVLTVFDPSLGFVTGGGTYLMGGDRVNLGFVGKVVQNKKNSVVKGSLLVIRHKNNGDVARIKSNVFDGLAIGTGASAGSATFSGKANYSVNGVTDPTNYDFTAYVVDGGTPGAGVDKFSLYHGKSNAAAGYEVRTSATLAALKSLASIMTLTGGNFQVPQPQK